MWRIVGKRTMSKKCWQLCFIPQNQSELPSSIQEWTFVRFPIQSRVIQLIHTLVTHDSAVGKWVILYLILLISNLLEYRLSNDHRKGKCSRNRRYACTSWNTERINGGLLKNRVKTIFDTSSDTVTENTAQRVRTFARHLPYIHETDLLDKREPAGTTDDRFHPSPIHSWAEEWYHFNTLHYFTY